MTTARPTTATGPTQIPAAASNTVLFAAQATTNARTIYNDSTATLYVKFGATASTTSYTVQIASQGYYEFPQPCYSGEVDGIWTAANGNAYVTAW